MTGGIYCRDVARYVGQCWTQFPSRLSEQPPQGAIALAIVMGTFGLHGREDMLINLGKQFANRVCFEAKKINHHKPTSNLG
jgi:hypothetical protein